MRFRIHRPTWARGEGYGVLLRDSGARCALGFLGHHLGVSDAEMLGETELTRILHPSAIAPDAPTDDVFDVQEDVVDANDSRLMPDKTRESIIAKHLSAIGIDVEFTDEPEPS